MKALVNFVSTSIGRKLVMGLTGIGLSGFLIVHLSGNLLVIVGKEQFNAYAEWLHHQPWLLPAQIGLYILFFVHIATALSLASQNKKARGSEYAFKAASDASMGSRSMVLTGLLVLVFLVFHLINFKFGDKSGPDGLYGLVAATLSHPFWFVFYLGAMALLGLHLSHGVRSALQSFGVNHPAHNQGLKGLCLLIAVALALGFASIPVWVILTQGGI